jgi:hypothetical protein
MKQYLFIASTILLSFFLTGCMMFMHGGMSHGNSHNEHSESQMPPTITKDVTIGDYHLVAEFPHLMKEMETTFSLRIYKSKDSLWTNASVRIRISKENGKEKFLVDEIVMPSADNEYAFSFSPNDESKYVIEFLVEQLDESLLKQPISLSATQEVMQMKMDHGSDSETSPWMYVGGAVMLAMMVAMIGRIF